MRFLKLGILLGSLVLTACTRDMKNDRPSTATHLDPDEIAQIQYNYGNYGSGFKKYQLDLATGVLLATWNQREIVEGVGKMVERTGSLTLLEADVAEAKGILIKLDEALLDVNTSDCGSTADGASESLLVTPKDKPENKIRIAEISLKESVCADGYVSDSSLQSLFDFFVGRLPEPESEPTF